jgi:hypothetical protein
VNVGTRLGNSSLLINSILPDYHPLNRPLCVRFAGSWLAQIALANGALGGQSRFGQNRQQHCRSHCNAGDDNEQFDQSESPPFHDFSA